MSNYSLLHNYMLNLYIIKNMASNIWGGEGRGVLPLLSIFPPSPLPNVACPALCTNFT